MLIYFRTYWGINLISVHPGSVKYIDAQDDESSFIMRITIREDHGFVLFSNFIFFANDLFRISYNIQNALNILQQISCGHNDG